MHHNAVSGGGSGFIRTLNDSCGRREESERAAVEAKGLRDGIGDAENDWAGLS